MGWTLEQLEELSGVATGSIFALEKRDSQRSKFFQPIARAFGLTIEQLGDTSKDWLDQNQSLVPQPDNSASNQPLAHIQKAQIATHNVASLDQLIDGLAAHLGQVSPAKRAAVSGILAALATDPDDASLRSALAMLLMPAPFAQPERKAA